MKWALIFLAITSLFELFIWTGAGWKVRRPLSSAVIVLLSGASGLIFGSSAGLWTGLILLISIYRVINLLRILEGRTDPDYLFVLSRRTSLRLIAGQIVIGLLWIINKQIHVHLASYLIAAGVIDGLLILILLVSTKRNLKTTRAPQLMRHYAARDLPSISVLIPARNETLDLEQCLTSLVASTYPKLEIIVLDDCSQNKNTPEIIKSFAHAGVRFIAGSLPPENWLAKNFAYDQLVDQASGELLVFAGVDTRFSPNTLSTLVETLIEKKKIMISVMPINKLPKKFNFASCLVQPVRYAWEIALPRHFNRPPVLSTCWLIMAHKLSDYGGLKAVSRSAIPESYFAKRAVAESDGYSFLRSDASVGLVSQKNLSEQRSTAIRTRYPQTHRRLELVGLISVLEAIVFVLPVFNLIWGAINSNWLVLILGVASLCLLSGLYAVICYVTFSKLIIKGIFIGLVAAIYDIGLINYSMWQYEFREVLWKGRNICLPIMRAHT